VFYHAFDSSGEVSVNNCIENPGLFFFYCFTPTPYIILIQLNIKPAEVISVITITALYKSYLLMRENIIVESPPCKL